MAEISDARNMEAAHMVGRDEAQIVQSNELIARITVQTCRQSGMSVIYTELLDYGGDEIYFKEEAALAGKTFGEALLAFEESALLGLQLADGRVQLNPPMETRIGAGDKIIAISADDDTIRLSGLSDMAIDTSCIREAQPTPAVPERTLILGWNGRGCSIINELDSYVAPGSELTVVADMPAAEAEVARGCGQVLNQRVTFQTRDTADRSTLEKLNIPTYQHVIVLAYTQTMKPQQADARTLITLLHLRNIEVSSNTPLSIVSEMLDECWMYATASWPK